MIKRSFIILFLFLLPLVQTNTALSEDYGLQYVSTYLSLKELSSGIKAEKDNALLQNEMLYLKRAKQSFRPEFKRAIESTGYYLRAVYHYIKSPSGRVNILMVVFFSLCLSLFLTLFSLVLSRTVRDLPLFVHEISESPVKLLFIVLLIPGLIDLRLMLLSLSVLLCFHMGDRQRRLTLLMMVILVIGFFFYDFLKVAVNVKTTLPAKAIELVNTDRSNIPAITGLKEGGQFDEGFSHALSLLKEKKTGEAIRLYASLSERYRDPRIDVNLGYLYALTGKTERAEESFQRALEKTESASAYYNLSMLYSERLDFKGADEFFLKAVKLDFPRVTAFREKNKQSPKATFMYDQLKAQEVFSYILQRAARQYRPSRETLYSSAFSVFAILFIALSGKLYKHRAIKCPKCGKIHCIRCERHFYWNGLCGSCYSSLVSFQAEPSERIKVILKTYSYSRRQRLIKGVFSFFIPGFILMQGERFIRGLSHCLIFFFFLFAAVLGREFEPLYLSGIHGWIVYPCIFMAFLVYAYSAVYTFKRVRKGWL